MQVNVHEAKTHLSRLLERVVTGEEVIIAKHGKPIARLCAIGEPVARRTPGRSAGKGRVLENFNDPLPDEMLQGFFG
jgi:prevent-host-death family protein